MDCLDLLSVQGILKSLLQSYSSKASIHPRSAFFILQISHPYMTTGKTIALTRWTFAGKVTPLLFNMLLQFSQFSHSVMSDYLQPHGLQHARLPSPSPAPRVAQTHVHRVGGAIQSSHPLLSPSLPAFNHSQHQGLSNESVLYIRWPKYWPILFSEG